MWGLIAYEGVPRSIYSIHFRVLILLDLQSYQREPHAVFPRQPIVFSDDSNVLTLPKYSSEFTILCSLKCIISNWYHCVPPFYFIDLNLQADTIWSFSQYPWYPLSYHIWITRWILCHEIIHSMYSVENLENSSTYPLLHPIESNILNLKYDWTLLLSSFSRKHSIILLESFETICFEFSSNM